MLPLMDRGLTRHSFFRPTTSRFECELTEPDWIHKNTRIILITDRPVRVGADHATLGATNKVEPARTDFRL